MQKRQNKRERKNRIKQIVFIVLIVGMGYFLTRDTTELSASSLHSSHVLFMESASGTVLYEKNADKKSAPASLTKMMTVLVALEKIEDLSSTVSIDSQSYQEVVAENGSMAGFVPGERVTYRDLLYGTMLNSGGEAANSLAISLAGDTHVFVEWMNAKAQQLNMQKTHFTNVEGFDDPKQYSTAADMATLTRAALKNGHFQVLFSTPSFRTTSTHAHPEGLMLKSTVLTNLPSMEAFSFSIIGGKSGTTSNAGECWVTLGRIENKEYISVVMGAKIKDFKQLPWHQKEDTLALFTYFSSESNR